MKIKAFFFASLPAPVVAFLYILIGSISDIHTGHLDISEALSSEYIVLVLLYYTVFVFISVLTTYLVTFILQLLLLKLKKYTFKTTLISSSIIGSLVALLTVFLLSGGSFSRNNEFYFACFGAIFSLFHSFIYLKITGLKASHT